MNSKIKIKIGQIEIEYEGSEEFLKMELPALLKAFTDLYKETGISSQETNTSQNVPPLANSSEAINTTQIDSNAIGTTNSIAAKLGAKTGTELAMAAAARLILGMKQQQFTRKQLLQEMQNATQYYKATYGSNLSSSLKTLVSDHKFIERAKDTYTLKAEVLKSLEIQLVQ